MINVDHLSKRFGSTIAVDDISFEIPQGQLVGFLGPNGAGKTTTMRLLTGYLSPDAGSAKLMGKDLLGDSIDIRQQLGYLPENNPLPEDIEVTDYLHFVGRLRGLRDDGNRMVNVKRVIKLCSLSGVIGKKIGELSKGYRQRVGLAQAIIHDPKILILDEPTSGLDPNQVQDVRDLIQDLKKEKTLLLSTHILSEVQSAVDRVLIISKGKIVADGPPAELTQGAQNINRLVVSFKGDNGDLETDLKGIVGVQRVQPEKGLGGEKSFVVESDSGRDIREDVFHLAVKKNSPILAMKLERRSLEDVFRALTKGGEPK